MRGLRDRRFLVAGGASGIGEATVLRLAEEGARVVVADRNGAAAARLAATVGDAAEWVEYDQGDTASIDRLYAAVVDNGPLNGVALVAGVHPGAIAFDDIPTAVFADIHAVNVIGVMRMVQLATRHVVDDRRSSLVVVGSVAGIRPELHDAVYASSKAAVQALTRSAALEFAPRGIRINSVLPGSVITPLAVSLTSHEAIEREARRILPIGVPAAASEIASTIAFLLSDDASHVTASELVVDGGLFANSP